MVGVFRTVTDDIQGWNGKQRRVFCSNRKFTSPTSARIAGIQDRLPDRAKVRTVVDPFAVTVKRTEGCISIFGASGSACICDIIILLPECKKIKNISVWGVDGFLIVAFDLLHCKQKLRRIVQSGFFPIRRAAHFRCDVACQINGAFGKGRI